MHVPLRPPGSAVMHCTGHNPNKHKIQFVGFCALFFPSHKKYIRCWCFYVWCSRCCCVFCALCHVCCDMWLGARDVVMFAAVCWSLALCCEMFFHIVLNCAWVAVCLCRCGCSDVGTQQPLNTTRQFDRTSGRFFHGLVISAVHRKVPGSHIVFFHRPAIYFAYFGAYIQPCFSRCAGIAPRFKHMIPWSEASKDLFNFLFYFWHHLANSDCKPLIIKELLTLLL